MKGSRTRRAVVATVLAAGAFAACGRQPGRDAVAKPTAWQQVLRGISPEGQVGKDTALQAFSLVFGPVPGVRVPTGKVPAILYGSGPTRWLTPYWGDLTSEQQGVVAKAVGPLGPMKAGATATTRQSMGSMRLISAEAVPDRYREAVSAALLVLRGHLPWDIPVEPTIELDPSSGHPVAEAFSHWPTDTATHIDGCLVKFYPRAQSASPAGLNAATVHELFHCFQAEVMGQGRYIAARPWVVEGSAMWVGEKLGGPSDLQVTINHWQEYLSYPGPEKRLFARSYDAIGFYSHLEESGVDIFGTLRGILTAGGNDASFVAAGVTDRFLTTWGSGFFREYPEAWDTSGPAILPKSEALPPVHPLAVGAGEGLKVDALGLASKLFRIAPGTDVIRVEAAGWGRVADSDSMDRPIARVFAEDFCTRDGGCRCPSGTEPPSPEATPVQGDLRLALTGDPASAGIGAGAQIFGESLDTYCRPKDKPGPAGNGGTGAGGGTPGSDPGGTGTVCEEITKRTTPEGLLNNPSMGPEEIQRCLDEILRNANIKP